MTALAVRVEVSAQQKRLMALADIVSMGLPEVAWRVYTGGETSVAKLSGWVEGTRPLVEAREIVGAYAEALGLEYFERHLPGFLDVGARGSYRGVAVDLFAAVTS